MSSSVPTSSPMKQLFHFFFADHVYSQIFSFIQLGTGVGTSYDVVSLFADRGRYAPTCVLNHLFSFVAGVPGQRAGQHECLAGKSSSPVPLLAGEGQTSFA